MVGWVGLRLGEVCVIVVLFGKNVDGREEVFWVEFSVLVCVFFDSGIEVCTVVRVFR